MDSSSTVDLFKGDLNPIGLSRCDRYAFTAVPTKKTALINTTIFVSNTLKKNGNRTYKNAVVTLYPVL